jgi:hypothetical protein
MADDDEPNAGYSIDIFSDRTGGTEVASVVGTRSVTGNATHNLGSVPYGGGAQYIYLRVRQADGNRAWTAPVLLEPGAAGPTGGGGGSPAVSVALVVDEQAETASITNTGTAPVDLTGWRLVSVRGNQVFDQFPAGFTLAPGQSGTITSGPNAQAGSGLLRWTTENIWNNSGDPGRLLDADGIVVAETGR